MPLRFRVVSGEAVILMLQPGEQRGARRDAARAGRIGAAEVDALAGQLVEVRGVRKAGAVQPQRVAPHLIDHDHDDIRMLFHRRHAPVSLLYGKEN